MTYEEKAYDELMEWQLKMRKKGSFVQKFSKTAQNKMNQLIPEKVHKLLTEAIKAMVKTVLTGSDVISKNTFPQALHLKEKETLINQQLDVYRKTAVLEGAGTGAGGLILGMADFPLLLSIKLKFLYDVAKIYGYDMKQYEERLFLLLVFQMAFSSNEKRRETLHLIENWEAERKILRDVDWQSFQQEYRDYIDLVKLLQLFPGIGAAVGAYANYKLLDQLGETAIYCYRLRYFRNLGNIKDYVEGYDN
ncbi:EcsC family protein [Caldibacillus lycopersici]|uniref:EcsC family protein n=1 Tax=Perspicuibacillus lycopersici TaxID=1325689 RepID=A0AAE3LPP1_9BACI|nr:EcsC family protein [Perspicuibacillus lycopersici]MCU9612504.1 EcsC family protein [Perspicuibacillus lycopersici]